MASFSTAWKFLSYFRRWAATVLITMSNFRKRFSDCLDSAITVDISSSEYCFSTTHVPSFGNVIFYLRSREEPLTRLGVASTPVLGVLLGVLQRRLVGSLLRPVSSLHAVPPAVTLRPRRYFLAANLARGSRSYPLSTLINL